jgi:hypothetical protein
LRVWARCGDFPDALERGSAVIGALEGAVALDPMTGAIGGRGLSGGVAVPVFAPRGLAAVLLLAPRLFSTVPSELAFGSHAD